MSDRGISPVLAYVLTLGITTLLVAGLFLSAGNFVGDQNDRAMRSELDVIGNRLAADIAAVDRLALAAGSTGEAELQTDLPVRAAGQQYEISITNVSGSKSVYSINLTVLNGDIEIGVRVKSQTEIGNNTVSGGNVLIAYNGTKLEVSNV